MRRTRIILASFAAMVGLAAVPVQPASAHFCANPVAVHVRAQSAVNIGIAAEEVAVVSVDVALPRGFTLDHPVEYGPWKATVASARVQFAGGRIEPYTCAFFSVVGTAAKKGAYAFALTTHAEDGSTHRYASTAPYDRLAAQMVYAGIPIPPASDATGAGRKGPAGGYGVALLVAIGAGALAVGAAVAVDRRRRG